MTEAASEDDDIEYVRKLRKQVVSAITVKGIPEDNESRALLLKALADVDRTGIALKKIKSDEGISNNAAMAADVIGKIFSDARLKTLAAYGGRADVPVLDLADDGVVVIPGELDAHAQRVDYDSFTA